MKTSIKRAKLVAIFYKMSNDKIVKFKSAYISTQVIKKLTCDGACLLFKSGALNSISRVLFG